MPLGILEKLNLEVACHILDLKESLLKLENKKNSYWIKRDKKIGSMRKQF